MDSLVLLLKRMKDRKRCISGGRKALPAACEKLLEAVEVACSLRVIERVPLQVSTV
jgi:hypothetical protein